MYKHHCAVTNEVHVYIEKSVVGFNELNTVTF